MALSCSLLFACIKTIKTTKTTGQELDEVAEDWS
jgi:hypothetical protein